jgi:osmotically-inducible protein OsmY
MRNDSDIQHDVVQELRWEPSLKERDLAVGVRDGVVTLGGFATSYADKLTAERVAARIKGVRAIANEVEVRLPAASARPDPELARAALDALKWNVAVPDERIQLNVDQGWIKLIGEVEWFFQKAAAEKAVRALTGVKGVTNLIGVKERPVPADIKERIKQTLERGAALDAEQVSVEIVGGTALLRGTVRAYAEKRDAERAARNAPGVTEVDNRITIDPYSYAAT